MAKAKSKAKAPVKLGSDGSKLFAFLAFFPPLLGLLLTIVFKRDDRYAMYYARQAIVLYLFTILIHVVLLFLPPLWLVGPFVVLLIFVLWIMGLIYSLSGRMKPLPFIGGFGEKLGL